MSIQPQHFRPFKIEVFGLQDAYLGTLYSYNDGFIGQVEEPNVTVSTDGSSTFTCSIPKYYIDPTTNQKVLNPRWGDVENGVLAENTRVLKVFVSFENEVKIFPFIINKIQDKRDKSFSVFKEVEGGGLAFAELGKQGYKLELNQTLVEYALEKDPNITMTVQYWLDQVFPNVKDANGKIIQWLTPWCYEVRMDWSNYSDFQRDSTKVYEDEYVSNWDVSGKALVPSGYTAAREKARAIDCHNSNKYNITQSIAEAFEIFCDYDYKCDAAGRFIGEYTDEKGNVWTGRKALFYNQAISQENPLHIYYQKNLQSISRAAESEELFTKLFVTPIESSSMENGYVTIADTMANPTLDDFLLNFDYLYSVNSISEYQMQFVKEYEASIRSLNLKLLHVSPILNDLVAQINDQKAELAGLDKQVAAAKEQLTYYEKLRDNELTNGTVIKDKSNATSIIFTEDNGVYKAALRFEGIVKGTIRGYKGSDYDTLLFSADQLKEITDISSVGDTGYYVLLDEYGYPSYICSKKPDESLVYLSLEYSPTNKYETICQTFYNEIDLTTQRKTAIEETISRLEENYTAQEKEYNNNLAAKEALNQKLERVLGPALREGYWTPDEYDDPGKQYIKQFTQPQFNSALSETCFFYDNEPFDNEQLAYYYIGSSKTYYPYLRINSLINKWSDKDIDNLVIHLQRDFVGTMQSTTALTAGNYFFLCNNKKYYFSLAAAQVATGNTLTVRMSGTEVSLLLNGQTPIVLSSYLANASNLTSFFEGATENLADYYLYNNAGFVFAFMNIEGNICEPVLLFNNEDLADIYENYTRVAYSFVGENIVTSIQGYLTKNTSHELYYPRFYLAEDNVFSSSNLLTVALKKDEEETILEKYYDYSILLRQGKTYITLKITSDNPIWKFVSNEYYYEVNYRSSLANDLLYLDAKEVAKENSQPKYSYDLSVAILPTQNGKMPEVKLGQLAYISDPILGVRAATGYVSEITFDLKKPQNDNIKIANYKTKFEDLFQTITASSEAMKNNQTSYDIAAGSFGPDGSISGDVIQTAINNNSFFFDYSATGVEIDPVNGIVLTNKKPYMNGVYGQVVLQGGGIFLSSSIDPLTGERIWNTGITPNGINASIINAGQLNTNLIKIYSGDEMAFQWNSEGIYAYKFDDNGKAKNDTYIKYSQDGLHYTKEQMNEDGTRSNPLHIVSLDWDGLTLCNNQGQKTLSLEAETGDLLISGTMQSFNYSSGIIGTGWKIDQAGYAEFNDIFVRGTISAAVFEYKETSAVGGELYVAPTIILENDKTAGARFTYTEGKPLQIAINIPFNDGYELAGRVWQVGDLVSLNGIVLSNDESQKYEIKNLRMKVSSLGERTTLVTEVPIYSTTNTIFYDEKGNPIAMAAVNGLASCKGSGKWHLIFLGSNGQREGILITAMANDGPYVDIYDDNPEKPDDKSPRVRLGKLDGLQNYPAVAALYPHINGYGLYSDNVYLKGAIYATSGKIGSLSINEVENGVASLDVRLESSMGLVFKEGTTTTTALQSTIRTARGEQLGSLAKFAEKGMTDVNIKFQKNVGNGWTNLTQGEWSGGQYIVTGIAMDTTTKYRVYLSYNNHSLNNEVYSNEISFTTSGTRIVGEPQIKYAVSSNGTTPPTNENDWSTSIKLTVTGQFLWTRTIITYSDGSQSVSYSVAAHGATGNKGDSAINYTLVTNVRTIARDLQPPLSTNILTITVNKTIGTVESVVQNLTSESLSAVCENMVTESNGSISLSTINSSIISTTKNQITIKLNDGTYGYQKGITTHVPNDTGNQQTVAVAGKYANITGIKITLKQNNFIVDTLTIPFTIGDNLTDMGMIQDGKVVIDGGLLAANTVAAEAIKAYSITTRELQVGTITAGFNSEHQGKIAFSDEGLILTGGTISLDGKSSINIATGGTFTLDSNNFTINADGSVEIKGHIEATSGKIGSLTIGQVENELDTVSVKIEVPGGPFIKGDNLVMAYLEGSFYDKTGTRLTKEDLESKFTNISINYEKSTLSNGSWGNWTRSQMGLASWQEGNNTCITTYPKTLSSKIKYRICFTYTKGEYNNTIYSNELVFAIAGTYITKSNDPEYAKSSDGITPPTSGWGSTIPATTNGEFLWTKIVIAYSDGSETVSYSVAAHGATGPTGPTGASAIQYIIIPSVTAISRDLITPISPTTLTYNILQSTGTTQTTIANLSGTGFTFKISNITGGIATVITNNTTNLTYDLTNYAQNKAYGNVDSIKLELYHSSLLVASINIPIVLGDDLRELGKIQDGQVIISDGKVYANAIASRQITAEKIVAGTITANEIAANTITVNKVVSNFGSNLDISSNSGIGLYVNKNGVKTSTITLNDSGISIGTNGTFTVTGNNFVIKADGSVEMKGKVTATKGAIGGWTIGETSLHSGSGTSYVALSSDSNSDYRIWAGGEKPAEASFAVTKTGAVYLNKVYVQTGYDEETKKYTYSTQSLSDYPLWAIWNAYNGNPVSMNYNNGTLTITTRGGTPLTANFNIAVGVGTDGNGNIFAVDSNGKQVGTSKSATLAANGTLSYTAGNTTALAYTNILLGGAVVRRDFTQVNVEPILNSVTVDTAKVDGTVTFTDTNYAQIPITVITTNKLTYMTTLTVDCDKVYKAGQESCAITSISLSNQFQSTAAKRVNFTATASGTNLDSFPKSLYVDASEIYEAGVEAGKAAMSLSRNGSTISIVENPNGAKSMSYTYVKSSHTKTGQYTCTYKESKFYWN